MDPVKKKLLADLWFVLRDLFRSRVTGGAAPFCASAPAQTPNDAGLCYFHLN